jgi:hypothetical protein
MGLSKYIMFETGVSILIGVTMGEVMTYFIFNGHDRISLLGGDGLLFDSVPQSFMVALMSVLVPSLLTHGRHQQGRFAQSALLPGMTLGVALTRKAIAGRALLVALAATVLGVATTAGLVALCYHGAIPFVSLMIFRGVYSAAIALILTPLAICTVLHRGDPIRPWALLFARAR